MTLNNEYLLNDLKTDNDNSKQQIFHTISTNIKPSEDNNESKYVSSLFEQLSMAQNKKEQKIEKEKELYNCK